MSDDAKKILNALQNGELPKIKESEKSGQKGLVNVRYNKPIDDSDYIQLLERHACYSLDLSYEEDAKERSSNKQNGKVAVKEREKQE